MLERKMWTGGDLRRRGEARGRMREEKTVDEEHTAWKRTGKVRRANKKEEMREERRGEDKKER